MPESEMNPYRSPVDEGRRIVQSVPATSALRRRAFLWQAVGMMISAVHRRHRLVVRCGERRPILWSTCPSRLGMARGALPIARCTSAVGRCRVQLSSTASLESKTLVVGMRLQFGLLSHRLDPRHADTLSERYRVAISSRDGAWRGCANTSTAPIEMNDKPSQRGGVIVRRDGGAAEINADRSGPGLLPFSA